MEIIKTILSDGIGRKAVLILGAIIGFFILVKIVKALFARRPVDIRNISLNNRWVDRAFNDFAYDAVADDFHSKGRPLKTKKGQYRIDFLNAVDKEYAKITKQCCDGVLMCDDLCRYAERHYRRVRAKDLYRIIGDFMEHREDLVMENLDIFLSECGDITPEEFFEVKKVQKGDMVGVYVIHNESRDMYYVGQAKKLFFRINQHFTGHGNGDVYADYKYGDDFSIKIIRLTESGYSDIDQLEKDLIEKYDACVSGYNKTAGNS